MPAAVANVAATMRKGGRLFFRDYAEGDLAQGRHQVGEAFATGQV
jgi:hypothetical protein